MNKYQHLIISKILIPKVFRCEFGNKINHLEPMDYYDKFSSHDPVTRKHFFKSTLQNY